MKKKILKVVAMVVTCAFALAAAGCSQNGNNTGETEKAAEVSEAEETEDTKETSEIEETAASLAETEADSDDTESTDIASDSKDQEEANGAGDSKDQEEVNGAGEVEAMTDQMIPYQEEYAIEARKAPAGYEEVRGLSAAELVAELKTGWNLGNTMDSEGGETAWGNPVTTAEMIDAVAAKGFNILRIPTSWGQFTQEKDGRYIIDQDWLDRVGEIADYALANDMYVIINTHHETGWIVPTNAGLEECEEKFIAIWLQIASYFKDYGDHVIFEGLNEPREVGNSQEWNGGNYENRDIINRLEQDFVDAVRSTGGNNEARLLLVTSEAAAVVDNSLKDVRVPDDSCIAMSLHAYTPYDFTFSHDGDYDTWDGSHLKDITWLFDQLDKYYLSKGIPVILTEYGAERKGDDSSNNDEEVCKWITDYLSMAKEKGVPAIIWDNGVVTGSGERFGFFNRKNLTWDRESVVDAIMNVIYD